MAKTTPDRKIREKTKHKNRNLYNSLLYVEAMPCRCGIFNPVSRCVTLRPDRLPRHHPARDEIANNYSGSLYWSDFLRWRTVVFSFRARGVPLCAAVAWPSAWPTRATGALPGACTLRCTQLHPAAPACSHGPDCASPGTRVASLVRRSPRGGQLSIHSHTLAK